MIAMQLVFENAGKKAGRLDQWVLLKILLKFKYRSLN